VCRKCRELIRTRKTDEDVLESGALHEMLGKITMVMLIFCLCDVGYAISVKIRVHTVQKVKRKNMLPKYVGRFTAELTR